MFSCCRSRRGKPTNCNSNCNSNLVPIVSKKQPKAAAAVAPAPAPALIFDPENPYCRLVPSDFKAENLLLLFYVQPEAGRRGEIFLKTIEKRGKDFIYTDATDEYLQDRVTRHASFPKNKFVDNIAKCTKEDLIYTVNSIKKHSCQGAVSDAYIASQTRENQIYVLLFDMTDKSGKSIMDIDDIRTTYDTWFGRMIRLVGKPVGFILGHLNPEDDRRRPKTEAYIDIVCSCPGAGRYLIQYFIDWTFEKGYSAVTLNALPNVLAYYPKAFGFKHQYSCNERDEDIITPPAALYDKKYLNKDPSLGKVYSGNDFYDDDEYANHMINLQEHFYGDQSRKDCKPEGLKPDGKYKKTKKQLKDGNCGGDGYRMRLCPRDRI